MKLAALKELQARRREQLARPRLAEGVELLGEYGGSGYKEPPYLVRRADGQTLQLSRLAYAVAEGCDGRTDADEIARRASESLGRRLTGEQVVFLVEQKLRPVGSVAGDAPTELRREHGVLALRIRTAVVPPRVVQTVARMLMPIFASPVVGAVVAWLLVLDAWLFFHGGLHGVAQALLARPVLLLAVLGLALVGTVLHECGHAAACRFGGARPGAMGVGFYLVWPAFYTDVTDAYRLDRRGRLRTDLGGVYLNAVFAVALAVAYFATGFAPLLFVVFLEHVFALQQFVPWIRLDGYYVLSDAAGVPDMLSRVKPTLLSLVPGRPPDPRVAELKPWVRRLVVGYVVTVVPALAAAYVLLVVNAPQFLRRAEHSWMLELGRAAAAWRAADAASLTLA